MGYTASPEVQLLGGGGGGAMATVTGLQDNTVTGAGGGLTKLGLGTISIQMPATYTGPTVINGGVFKLDFAANTSYTKDMVSPLTTMRLNGGTLMMATPSLTVSTRTQDIAGLVIGAGVMMPNTIVGDPGKAGTDSTNSVLLRWGRFRPCRAAG